MKLYKFSHPSTTETILLVTPQPCSDNALRSEMGDYDQGGMDFDLFAKLVDEGTVTEVHSLEECGEGWTLDLVPYGYVDDDGNYGTLEKIFVAMGLAGIFAGPPKEGVEKKLEEIQSLFRNTRQIIGRPCQFPAFHGRKFVENENGQVVLEVIWGSFDDQKFYAEAHQNTKFLLEYIEKLQTKSNPQAPLHEESDA